MSQDDIIQIKVDKHSVGIMGLKNVMEEMAGDYEERPDDEITAELLNRLSQKNYISNSAKESYGRAFLREFKKFTGKSYNEDVPENIEALDDKIYDFINDFWILKRSPWYKMYCSFGHIFWGWYSAWYYSYMWAEILEADVFARIKEQWMFDPKVWEQLVSTLLGQWTRKKATELFGDFMERDVDNTAFMKRTGLL